jgi:hypothetical protein
MHLTAVLFGQRQSLGRALPAREQTRVSFACVRKGLPLPVSAFLPGDSAYGLALSAIKATASRLLRELLEERFGMVVGIPRFPRWARQQGTHHCTVSIPDMLTTQSSRLKGQSRELKFLRPRLGPQTVRVSSA